MTFLGNAMLKNHMLIMYFPDVMRGLRLPIYGKGDPHRRRVGQPGIAEAPSCREDVPAG
jgi:hypothetical protein